MSGVVARTVAAGRANVGSDRFWPNGRVSRRNFVQARYEMFMSYHIFLAHVHCIRNLGWHFWLFRFGFV